MQPQQPLYTETAVPPFVWTRRLNVAAITCALQFTVDNSLTVTGYASVMALNPFGPPKTIRSLAIVSHGSVGLVQLAERLRDYIDANIAVTSCQATPNKVPFRIDTRFLETMCMLALKVGDDQVVTLSAHPLRSNDALWLAPLCHNEQSWTVYQYVPAALRAHLLFRGAFSLVQCLDGFIAERCLWNILDGLVVGPPWDIEENVTGQHGDGFGDVQDTDTEKHKDMYADASVDVDADADADAATAALNENVVSSVPTDAGPANCFPCRRLRFRGSAFRRTLIRGTSQTFTCKHGSTTTKVAWILCRHFAQRDRRLYF